MHNVNKYVLYRITSRVNQKPRMKGFSKLTYLDNLFQTFSDYRIICVADNCDDITLKVLKKKPFYKFVITSLGNARSFNYLINQELPLLNDDDLVYFAEDDYLYTHQANKIFEDGLQYFDYVTLYDHPDKYGDYSYDLNLLVPKGQLSEYTQILKSRLCLWRTTNSTTMSFGCYAKTIKRDKYIWNFFSKISKIPRDFYIWMILICPTRFFFHYKVRLSIILIAANFLSIFKHRRTLGVPVPSASSHMEVGMLPDNFNSDFGKN